MKLDGSGNLEINGGEYKYSTAKTRWYTIPPAEIKCNHLISHYNVSFLSGCSYISDGNTTNWFSVRNYKFTFWR